VLVLTSLASFIGALDALVVSTALSTLQLDHSASVEQLEWTVNSYTLSFAVLLMTAVEQALVSTRTILAADAVGAVWAEAQALRIETTISAVSSAVPLDMLRGQSGR